MQEHYLLSTTDGTEERYVILFISEKGLEVFEHRAELLSGLRLSDLCAVFHSENTEDPYFCAIGIHASEAIELMETNSVSPEQFEMSGVLRLITPPFDPSKRENDVIYGAKMTIDFAHQYILTYSGNYESFESQTISL